MSKARKNQESEGDGTEVSPYGDFPTKAEWNAAKSQQIWGYSDTGHDLTVEEQLFCRSYIIDRNPIAALRRLDYSESTGKLQTIADRHLRNPEVQGCIEVLAKRMMEKLDVTAEKVNAGLAEIAFNDPGELMQFDTFGVSLMPSQHWTPGQRRTVQSVEMGKEGIKLRFYDRQKALETLGKQIGVVKDDATAAREQAEAAAAHAVNKILEVTQRMRERPQLSVVPNEEKSA